MIQAYKAVFQDSVLQTGDMIQSIFMKVKKYVKKNIQSFPN